MKKSVILLILTMFLFNVSSYSQISWGGIPFSSQILQESKYPENKQNGFSTNDYVLKDLEAKIINADYNWEAIYQEDDFNNNLGLPMRTGVSVLAGLNPDNSGTWEELPCGTILWRLKVVSPGAKSISLIVNDFYLPDNSRLFVYDETKTHILGSFNSANNNDEKVFTTHLLPGNTVIVEFEQSPGNNNEQTNSTSAFKFNIESLLYNYVNGGPFAVDKGLGDSGPCMVNVNCPEGNDWQKEKRGVAKIIFRLGGSWYLCSGSLVNNTSQNAVPYFLTAEHCGGDATAADRDVWQFYFNYERSGCSNTGTPPNNMLTGSTLKAIGPLNGGSDFQLLTLNSNPAASWNPYFNGWNRNTSASSAGVSIHHPSGDAKKISTYNTTLTSATITIDGETMAANSSWRVYWASTQSGHSVTEGGSSGSPIFNNTKQIIGTLTGGGASCSNTSAADFYGKVSYHWESNGTANSARLRPWLDPVGTNPFSLGGYDPYNDDNDNETILSEGFEGGIPSGWTQKQEVGGLSWLTGTGNDAGYPANAYSGTKNAYYKITSEENMGYKTKLITPALNIPAGSTAVLSFYMHNQVWEGDQDRLRLYYRTSPTGSWTLFGASNENLSEWTYQSFYLPNPSSNYYIAFENEAYWGRGICIDEVKVDILTNVTSIENETLVANIFPNPAMDNLFVSVFTNEPKYEISIMDIQGRIIETRSVNNQETHVFNIAKLTSGIYLVKISGKELNKTMKFVKTE
jgi:hypothetical protein